MTKTFVTFIIPTIGRSSLSTTLESLLRQTLPHEWRAVLVFDGVAPTVEEDFDPRIKVLTCEKMGLEDVIDGKVEEGDDETTYVRHSCAGLVRNHALEYLSSNDSEWFAFLDDDDSVSEHYVDRLKEESTSFPDVDVIVFRMLEDGRRFLPGNGQSNFETGRVGISFAIKNTVQTRFVSSTTEDYDFLRRSIEDGYKVMCSPYLTYFVRSFYPVTQALPFGNRFFG
jgi:hypothetical protein